MPNHVSKLAILQTVLAVAKGVWVFCAWAS